MNKNLGKVYIAGAGSGGLELLTLKVYDLITKKADIVIHDRLVAEDIINSIRPEATKIFAGKEPKLHHMTQNEINDAIVKFAKEGKTVIRLKGGDPTIFGRGGEEAEILKANNIDFEIIPGISAAFVAASELALPLTYRKIADGVIFISGHSYKDNIPELDWESLAQGNNTIVLYMGVGSIKIISKKLIEHGMEVSKPCVAIQNAGLKSSTKIKTRLSRIAEDILKNNISNPAIIIIGEVVNKSLFDW